MSLTIEERLKRVAIFTLTTDEQIKKLIADSKRIDIEAGTLIFSEGDQPDGMYVILDGTVRIHLTDEQGMDVELGHASTGEVFGELAVLDSGERTASVSTVTDCDLLHIGEEAFLDLVLYSRSILVYEMLRDMVSTIRGHSRRIRQEELQRLRTQSEMEIARHRSLNQMIAGLAHELNTPLGIVNTAASIISQRLSSDVFERVQGDPELASAFEDILDAATLAQRNIQRAHRLVRAFKSVSISQLIDEIDTVDLLELTEEVGELFKINAKRAGITLNIENHITGSNKWVGYPGYYSQILMNLLTNVERYAYPDGVGGTVTILLEDNQETFTVTVRDTGEGIAPDDLERIFEPFFTTGRNTGGTGLGLTIVYNIINGPLKGSINVQSEVGKGSTFTLTFPRVIERDPPPPKGAS